MGRYGELTTTFSIDGEAELKRLMRKLDQVPQGFERAMNRAVNRTARASLVMIAKGITNEIRLNVKQRDVKALLRVKRSNFKSLVATVVAHGRARLGLFEYGAIPKTPEAKKPPLGARYTLMKGERNIMLGGFIARMQSGHVGLFTRVGASRTVGTKHHRERGHGKSLRCSWRPGFKKCAEAGDLVAKGKVTIRERFGPNIMAYMDPDKPFVKSIKARLKERLRKEAEHEIRFLLDKAGIGVPLLTPFNNADFGSET